MVMMSMQTLKLLVIFLIVSMALCVYIGIEGHDGANNAGVSVFRLSTTRSSK
jgi:hypothetical protein